MTGRRRLRGVAWPAGLLGLAVLLALVGAPAPLRSVFSLPAVVAVAGLATTRLVLGCSGGDRLVRWLLSAVLGVMTLLFAVLLTSWAGIPLGSTSVVLGSAAFALLLLGAAEIGRRPPQVALPASGPQPVSPPPLSPRSARRVGLVATVAAGTAGLLVGALVVASDLRPVPAERYTVLSFTDPALLGADPVTAAAGARLTLRLSLTSYGYPLPQERPEVRLVLAGRTITGARASWHDVPAVGPAGPGTVSTRPESERTGRLTFRAPTNPGLFAVEVSTTGTSATDRLVLTTYLLVRDS